MPSSYWGTSKPPAGVPVDRGHPLARGLLGYWPLTNGSGWDAFGSSHLVKGGKTVVAAPGRWGSATHLTSANVDRAVSPVTSQLYLPTPFMTVAFWAKLDTLTNFMTFVSMDTNSGTDRNWACYTHTDGRFSLDIRESDATVRTAAKLGAVTTGVWNFYCGWVDPSDNKPRATVNNAVPTAASTALTTAPDGVTPLYLGTVGDLGNLLNGSIEGLGYWGRALTSDERTQLYAQPYAMFAAPVWRRYFVPGAGIVPQRMLMGVGS